MSKRILVVSAVNFHEAGPLSILQDCLGAAVRKLRAEFRIVALVHSASLCGVPGVHYLEFPRSRGSWLRRLGYEYWLFGRLSRRLKPAFWLSLHDISPRVTADRQAVYCHNPAPFHDLTARDAWLEPKFALFNKLYAQLYRCNISSNHAVIVQQTWLADEFRKRFGLNNIVVARPGVPRIDAAMTSDVDASRPRFVFPTMPRVFKNIEVLGEAARILRTRGHEEIEFLVTIDGTENRYARFIRRRYGDVPSLRLIGRRSRQEVFELYGSATGLVFPSRLETWGLPLSEFQAFERPILAADLPYARETLRGYLRAKYFPPTDAGSLAAAALETAAGTIQFDPPGARDTEAVVDGWDQLLERLTT